MKTIFLLLPAIISCGRLKPDTTTVDIGKGKDFVLIQRTAEQVNGSKEKLEISIGDITHGHTEVTITGVSSRQNFLHRYMQQNDKGVIDYYGNPYLLEIRYFENHLLHDDKAGINIMPLTKEEAAQLQQENKEEELRQRPATPHVDEQDTSLYRQL